MRLSIVYGGRRVVGLQARPTCRVDFLMPPDMDQNSNFLLTYPPVLGKNLYPSGNCANNLVCSTIQPSNPNQKGVL
jgi:hypothetical protein